MDEVLESTEALTAQLTIEPVELGIERPEDWYDHRPTNADGDAVDRFLGMGTMTRPNRDVVAEVPHRPTARSAASTRSRISWSWSATVTPSAW
ncbi:hypothetical protein [Actinoalloteichus hymeniacidonis]|uniref:Uncharacterized protein n=1 Tax=Actinoalloteichus hymeniacidonis TaxID=340345 RepID=A0AAC9HP39_9PSEU|nr:hypothetical protein [Actinoalloteichus hymeniacidonis]AOS62376.1 hypothetical protein TL08_07790 [Actinoalloteichus hymeniacidonis]MBB5909596.1 hypothetical protein [Actinoalloteichus hymeniacidonis]